MSISANNVTKLYGKQKALNDVSFSIGSGEIVGFLGPNGAGKSTMMKIITCYLPSNEGEVNVCGLDVRKDPIQVKKKVGYLPEHNPLYLDMYVKEYLAFIGGIYGLKKKKDRVKEMIDLVGLQKEQHKKIGALSKGYRQRVGLAQAIIHDPEVLILDEPTSGLDPNQLVEIRKLIQNIGQEKTVMLSTHIMQEVEAICQRAIIIDQGNIVADSAVADLKQMGQESQQVVVIAFAQPASKKLPKLEGVRKIEQTSDRSYEIITKDPEKTKTDYIQWAVSNQLNISEVSSKEMNMEEVFKNLTN
ncbi:MAG: gliding motility-associated ABC transporter ATP-binding subunit GldA [Bacteroidota bacterium]